MAMQRQTIQDLLVRVLAQEKSQTVGKNGRTH